MSTGKSRCASTCRKSGKTSLRLEDVRGDAAPTNFFSPLGDYSSRLEVTTLSSDSPSSNDSNKSAKYEARRRRRRKKMLNKLLHIKKSERRNMLSDWQERLLEKQDSDSNLQANEREYASYLEWKRLRRKYKRMENNSLWIMYQSAVDPVQQALNEHRCGSDYSEISGVEEFISRVTDREINYNRQKKAFKESSLGRKLPLEDFRLVGLYLGYYDDDLESMYNAIQLKYKNKNKKRKQRRERAIILNRRKRYDYAYRCMVSLLPTIFTDKKLDQCKILFFENNGVKEQYMAALRYIYGDRYGREYNLEVQSNSSTIPGRRMRRAELLINNIVSQPIVNCLFKLQEDNVLFIYNEENFDVLRIRDCHVNEFEQFLFRANNYNDLPVEWYNKDKLLLNLPIRFREAPRSRLSELNLQTQVEVDEQERMYSYRVLLTQFIRYYNRDSDDVLNKTKESPNIIFHFERIMETLILMYNSTNWMICMLNLKVYLSSVFEISLCEKVLVYIHQTMNNPKEGLETQTLYDSFKSLFSDWKGIYKGEFVAKICKIIGCIISMGFCSMSSIPFCTEKFEKFYKSSGLKDQVWPDLVTCIIESAIFIFEKCASWFKGEIKFLDIIRSPSAAYEYDKELAFIITNIGLYEDDCLNKVNIERHEYENRLDVLFEKTRNFYEKSNGGERRIMGLNLKDLERTKYRVITSSMSMSIREAPFSWALYGDTSVGKTAASILLINAMSRVNNLNPEPKYIVHINASDKYQSELQTWHTTVSVDDVGNTKAEFEEGCSTQMILDYVNNDPKHAVKADVDSKGKVLIKPKLFCVTTNVKDVQAHVKSNEPLAILRRLNVMITMVVKHEYRKPGTHYLDPDKMVDKVNDAWIFTVQEAVPVVATQIGATPYTWKTLHDDSGELVNIGLDRLIKYLTVRSRKHFEQQARLLRNVAEIHNQGLCEHGSYDNICVDCIAIVDKPFLEVQSLSNILEYDYLDSLNRKWHYIYEAIPYYILENSNFQYFYNMYAGKFDLATVQRRYRQSIALLLFVLGSLGFYCGGSAIALSILLLIVYTNCMIYFIVNHIRLTSQRLHKKAISAVQPFIEHKYKIIAGVSISVLVIAALKKFRPVVKMWNENLTTQGNIHKTPSPDVNYKENVWVKPHVVMPPRTIQVSTTTLDQLSNIVEDDLSFAIFTRDRDDLVVRTDIFPLCGNTWLINHHCVEKNFDYVELIRRPGAINNNRKCRINRSSWVRIDDSDLAVISLPSAGDNKNLLPYIPEPELWKNKVEYVVFLYKNEDCTIHREEFPAEFNDTIDFMCKSNGVRYNYPGWIYNMKENTRNGLCMAPIISRGKYPWILGFHSAGDVTNTTGVAHYIGRTRIEFAMRRLYHHVIGDSANINVQVHSSGDMKLDFPDYNVKQLNKLHFKSPFNFFTKSACANLYGAHSGTRRRFRSEVVPTLMSESVLKHTGIKSKHGPPKNIGNWIPWALDAELVTQALDMDLDILALAYADLENHIHTFLNKHPEYYDLISPMSRVATLSGVDACKGIDSIKLSTSAGFPRCKPKSNYVFETDEEHENITRPLDADPEVWTEVERVMSVLRRGERVYFIHRVNLKDEPTKLEKEKVRTFAGCTLECLILIRMFFLPIAKMMMDNTEIFECAVGVNAHGPDWTRLTQHIQKHGTDRIVAGDYKAYDSLMWCFLVLLAFDLLIRIAIKYGYDESDIMIMRGIATELAYGLVEYNGEYAEFLAQNLSGHGLTVFINNIVNCLYMRFAYYDIWTAVVTNKEVWLNGLRERLRETEGDDYNIDGFFEFYLNIDRSEPPKSFAEVVSLICYGDDNKMSVSKDINFFNHTTISYSLHRNGITYTMADKESNSVPFIHSNQCTFLKRHSVWNEKYQQYLAPLEMDSIIKTLHSCVASKVLSKEEQAYEALDSVIRELWYHGRDIFDEWRSKLQLVLIDCNLCGFYKTRALPTFDYLESEYIRKYLSDSDIKNNSASTPIDEIAKNGFIDLDTQCSVIYDVTTLYKAYQYEGIVSYLGQCSPAQQHHTQLGHNSKPIVLNVWIATNTMNKSDTNTINMVKPVETTGTISFRDGSPQWESDTLGAYDCTREIGMDQSVPLDKFFERPIRIVMPDWVPGSLEPYSSVFDPWTEFFENKYVANRISNYNLLQAQLHVKLVINGNSFYYGRLMADYVPLADLRPMDKLGAINPLNLIEASQRQHIFLDPCSSQGGEMKLPFIWLHNALNIPNGDWSKMGKVYVREMNSLKHANAATTNVGITAYVWATDVRLSVPTTARSSGLQPQSQESYGDGKPQIPISNYSKGSSLIGNDRTNKRDTVMYTKPKLISNMVNTDASDASTKLTMLKMQGLSIDPRIVGVNTGDELNIAHIASRESYIYKFPWNTTANTDNTLFNVRVGPALGRIDADYLTANTFHLPACCFAAIPFKYWRGTMRYRFQIVCSEHHKGRLRFTYDPQIIDVEGVLGTSTNVGFHKIIDIAQEKDFTIDIAWGQDKTFLPVPIRTVNWDTICATTDFESPSTSYNGVLGVYVVNELTSPNSVTNNDISINVFISMTDDCEFAIPCGKQFDKIVFNPQSDESGTDTDNIPVVQDSEEKMMMPMKSIHLNDVFFGEKVSTFRSLLNRFCYFHSQLSTASGGRTWRITSANYPYYRGLQINGIHSLGQPVNVVRTTFINYLGSAFLATRGGIRRKLLYRGLGTDTTAYARVTRGDTAISGPVYDVVVDSPPAGFDNSTFATYLDSIPNGGFNGTDITMLNIQPILEYELPDVKQERFSIPKNHTNTGIDTGCPFLTNHTVEIKHNVTSAVSYDLYIAAGADFNFVLFQGCPPNAIVDSFTPV